MAKIYNSNNELIKEFNKIQVGTGRTYNIDDLSLNSEIHAIKIENGVKRIGHAAFANYKNIESIEIPNSVEFIDEFAFSNCSNLRKVVLSNSIECIENNAFDNCKNLSIIMYKQHCQNCKKYNENCIACQQSYSTGSFPSSLRKLGNKAFRGCGFYNIEIPEGVKELGYGIFWNCKNLKSVSCLVNDDVEITDFSNDVKYNPNNDIEIKLNKNLHDKNKINHVRCLFNPNIVISSDGFNKHGSNNQSSKQPTNNRPSNEKLDEQTLADQFNKILSTKEELSGDECSKLFDVLFGQFFDFNKSTKSNSSNTSAKNSNTTAKNSTKISNAKPIKTINNLQSLLLCIILILCIMIYFK